MLTEHEAKKQGLAWWHKDTFVEINLFDYLGREHDPVLYWAKVLESGPSPELRVVTDELEPDDRFPEPLKPGQYIIWNEV